MNKTLIEWCDYTWNPVTGCKHGCTYCYARKIAERFKGSKAWPQGFEPICREDRWGEPYAIKKPQVIFVCSMADLFGAWVPDEWITRVFDSIAMAPQHTYLFLTKNPARYAQIPTECFQDNRWFGTTVTNQADAEARIPSLTRLRDANTFISFEPLLGQLSDVLDLHGIGGIIIGAQTNPSVPVTPEQVRPIGSAADQAGNVPIFCKNSMPGWASVQRRLPWHVTKISGD